MKPLLIAAALLLGAVATATSASAQVAAGSMPNTFDRPAQAAAAPVPTPAPAQATPVTPAAPAPALGTAAPNPASEETLRAYIASAQAGTIDYSMLTENLAVQLRQQETAIKPLFQQFGPLRTIDFVGSREEYDYFAVVFANAATSWVISLTDEGKISALQLFPAE